MRNVFRHFLLGVFVAIVSVAFAACGETQSTEQPVIKPTETYSITFSVENDLFGSVLCKKADGTTVSSGEKFEKDTPLTLTATANAGYSFGGWYAGADRKSDNAEYSFTMPSNDLTLVAKFTLNSHAFAYSIEDENKGTVDCAVASGTAIPYGTSLTLTATPETGYDFAGWFDGETAVSTDAEYSFSMPDNVVALQAKFTLQKRTVNFYVDSDVIGTKQVDYNTAAPTDEITASKENHDFINWFTDPELENVYGGEPITTNTDLYAKFTAEIIVFYTVRFFDYDGSKVSGDQQIEQGSEIITIPANPKRIGYDFNCWAFDNAPLSDGVKVNGDMDIYATYTQKSYDVHFYVESGVELDGYPVQINHGETAVKPMTPTKENYVFVRWLLDNEYEFDFDTPITDDVLLYAEWKAAETTFTVEFYDGTILKDRQEIESGSTATAPQTPKKDGFTFVKWVLANEEEFDFDAPITADVSVYAYYETSTVEITFVYYDDNESKDVETKITVNYGSDATELAPKDIQVVKTGYTFDGWDKAFTDVKEDIKITAIYTINTFTATFVLGEDTYATETADYGTTFKIPMTPDVAGYSFMGWFKDKAFTLQFDFTAPATENAEVYGKLEEIVIQTYSVKFLDFDNRIISEQTVVLHEAASAPGNPSRTGYTFDGWNGAFGDVTENLMIRATYSPNAYSITYYKEDGATVIDTAQAYYGTDASGLVSAPKETGKSFIRWSKDLSFVTKDTEVVAIYAKNSVVVRFIDEDGITELCASQNVEYGGNASIPSTPTKAGCIFKGWVVSVGSDEAFDFNTEITAATEIYARWEDVSGFYNVYFKDYDGNAYGTVQRIRSGFTAEEPSAPVKDGVVFDGWYVLGTEVKFDFDTPITQTITLVAREKAD